jgi:hypothetical protein
MTYNNGTYPSEATYVRTFIQCLPAMKLLTAEAVDPLSFLVFSTEVSTARLAACFAFSGIGSDDFAISVSWPISWN